MRNVIAGFGLLQVQLDCYQLTSDDNGKKTATTFRAKQDESEPRISYMSK